MLSRMSYNLGSLDWYRVGVLRINERLEDGLLLGLSVAVAWWWVSGILGSAPLALVVCSAGRIPAS